VNQERLFCEIGSLTLKHPVICGSGEHVMTANGIRAALRAGASVVIAKSVNERPETTAQLESAEYAALDAGFNPTPPRDANASIFCRSGLAPYSENWFAQLAELDREARGQAAFVGASIVLADARKAAELAASAQATGLRLLELNVGAPHGPLAAAGAISTITEEHRLADAVKLVRNAFSGALWIKLTGLQSDVSPLAAAAKAAGADSVGLAGRMLGFVPDLETLSPLLNTPAAYGGRWALPLTCRHLALARERVGSAYPLIGTSGARTGRDVARLMLAGASAVQIASVIFLRGFAVIPEIVGELDRWLASASRTARDVTGFAADRLQSYAMQTDQRSAWRQFVPADSL